MQALQQRRVLFDATIRYRPVGEAKWRTGEAVEIDRSELTFLSETALELGAEIEILLPVKVHVLRGESPLTLLCAGRVVRRALANWPELRSTLMVSLATCEVASEAVEKGARHIHTKRPRYWA